eukprot:GFUD01100249.1.p1 GENE.GFUD01100249.1~~GFUD01100249.1.p1  ORF type:complete len:160 (-),score=38.33 GFUD01100249.1:114-593(-)
MQHFGVTKFINLAAAIIFLVMGIILLMGFSFSLSVEEIQQTANFLISRQQVAKFLIHLAGVVALLASGVFAFGSWTEFQMYSGNRNSVMAEMIYILGLGIDLVTPVFVASESSVPSAVSSSKQDIFDRWTFAGGRPVPKEDPEKEDGTGNEDKKKEKKE